MGFGTLFIGYFLLLNVTYYGFSDFICSAIILYALYRLSSVNKGFRAAAIAAGVFCVFSLYELTVFIINSFTLTDISAMLTATAALRSLIVCGFTVPMLIGMRDVCYEVDLKPLGKKCHKTLIPTFVIYTLGILIEAQGVFSFIDMKYIAMIGLAVTLAMMILVIVNLVSIYSCYMKICMPDEQTSKKRKTPAFVEAFRRHEEEKQREYIEYRLAKKQAKAKKKSGKK